MFNKTSIIITASALAVLALILIQFIWICQSRVLLEEQFDNKVRMAMCMAVENNETVCSMPSEKNASRVGGEQNNIADGNIETAIQKSLAFYDIPLEYTYETDVPAASCGKDGYCCSMTPFVESEDRSLRIHFPDKTAYIFNQMGLISLSSICLVLFVSFVFFMVNYRLFKQKKIQEINLDFFNNMAHEFSTPLTNISLAKKLLLQKSKTEKEKQLLDIISKENQKLQLQIDRFLQLAKIENGNYALHKEAVPLDEILQDLVAEMQIQIQEKNVDLNLHFPDGQTLVYGDRFHLSNAFRNLIDNALKYSSDKAQIDISIQKNGKGNTVIFQDNGIGIPLKDQKEIFSKFYRVNTGNIHAHKGFGIGLAYVKMIMDAHKGVIEIFSELGKGSRFDLFLPYGQINQSLPDQPPITT